jgi:hypothetical protein
VTSYRALATNRTLVRLVTLMPPEVFEHLYRAATARGETIREYVGRVAFRAGRMQDVELVQVSLPQEPNKNISLLLERLSR